MKRLLTLFLLMCMSLSAMASETSVKNAEGVEIWYDFNSSIKIASVTYKGGSYDSYDGEYSGEVVIPSTVTYDGVEYSVTSIGNYAFRECSALTSITLPESLASIRVYAFKSCSSLTSITIPEGVTSIYDDAFSGCSALTSITLTESVTEIRRSAFQSCDALTEVNYNGTIADWCGISFGDAVANPLSYARHLYIDGEEVKDLVIPSGVTAIKNYAFHNCSALTSITIPEGVTSIGDYAFCECSALTSITLPESLTSIGKSAFRGCSALTSITLPEGLTSIGDYTFYECDALTSITLPEGVTLIGNSAFSGCNSLTSITLPESLTSIGDDAFYDCYSLTSITLPESLTSIGDYAFSGCCKLYEVYNKSDLTITAGSSDNGRVAYYAKNVYSEGESKLKTVGDYIFYVDGEDIKLIAYTGSETSITLPSDYEGKNYGIGERAFYNCDSLTSITLPESLTSIEDYAFRDCDSLTSITIPEGVTTIGEDAFWDCKALTSITLPKGLTSIGDEAFHWCSALTEVNYNGTIADWCGISFGDDEANPLYYAKHLYIDGEEVKDLVIPSGVTAINNYAFYNCGGLTSVTLPEGVTSIGHSAFLSCSALTSIILPESLTSIEDYAFYNCDKLDEVYNKSDLTITARSNNNGYVAYYANNVYNNVKTVGNYIFTVVGGTAELITYTGDETSLTLPSDCEGKDYKINYKAFYGCDALTSITIPEGVTSIGHSAFDGCSALTSITSKNTTPPTIGGKYTFDDVDKSIPVYVPKSSVDAYKGAEYWKDFTNIIGAYFVDVIAENGTVEGARAYVENNEATLTATPNEGYKFVQWSDGVTDNTRTVVVVSDTTFTAVFELKEYTVAVTAKNGTVEGVGTYKHGAEATLIVTPIEGYKFVKWSDGVTDNPRTIEEVTSYLTLTAEIYKLCSVYATTEYGFISGAGEYVDGDEVTLTATPFDGYEFFMWRDKYGNAVSFDANYTFTVTSDVELTAVFKEDDNPISDIHTSDVNVRLIGNRVVVEGADDYTVYSVSGQNLGKVESVERGIYIVVVNGKSYKVVAK